MSAAVSKELLSPTSFKTYDELKKDLAWVTFEDTNSNSSSTPSVSVAEKAQSQAPAEINTGTAAPVASAASTSAANDELDSLLAGLL